MLQGPHVMPQHHQPFMMHNHPSMMSHHLSFIQHQEHQRNLLLQHEMAARAQMHMMELSRAELASTLKRNHNSMPLVAADNIPITTEVDVANRWHEGLEDDVKAELEGENLGHEGVANGATIDELTAAWAQAEAEYERDMSNLWVGDSQVGEEPPLSYEFTNKDLPPEQQKDRDWLEEGIRHFREGNIREAIYSFEMELQHHNPDSATAWKMLGRCHAENDQDRQAIACLEQAVERDPYCTDALLALGVSYVNELDNDRALLNLKAWITHNPKFAGLDLSEDVYGVTPTAGTRENAFEEVQTLLLRALEFDPTDAADVHEALGVVYNVSRDYEAAVASFRKAIELRPDDYQLWNKLGATLANSNQSDKALPAYHHALQLKPKYARAWLNMAISHSNLQNYGEAARCYLQTISLNPSAVHCWSYLRIALSCSERWDLIPFAASQDLKAFRDHYDFIMYGNDD
jgi:peroxin-5